jgi:lysophospholipase L1-like esterase
LAVAWRHRILLAVAAGACLVLAPATPARDAPRAGLVSSVGIRAPAPTPAPQPQASQALAGCERRLEQAGSRPSVLAVVGASFTAGVGPDNPNRSWAVLLARLLRWDAVVYGDPGAGYVRAGAGHLGPVAAEVAREDLRALAPALVIVQAGHDDIGVPPGTERRRVEQTIALIRAEAPRATIALLTVFPGHSHSSAAYRTDGAIVAAGRAADHGVIIMDPLAARWTFSRSRDGLHPTAAGDAWIARRVAAILGEHGVRPGLAAGGDAIVCDAGSAGPAPHGHRADRARVPSGR